MIKCFWASLSKNKRWKEGEKRKWIIKSHYKKISTAKCWIYRGLLFCVCRLYYLQQQWNQVIITSSTSFTNSHLVANFVLLIVLKCFSWFNVMLRNIFCVPISGVFGTSSILDSLSFPSHCLSLGNFPMMFYYEVFYHYLNSYRGGPRRRKCFRQISLSKLKKLCFKLIAFPNR